MPTCPVCGQEQNADDTAFSHHVNSHFGAQEDAGPSRRPISNSSSDTDVGLRNDSAGQLDTCPVCSFPLAFLTPVESSTHLNSCLDTTSQPQSLKRYGTRSSLGKAEDDCMLDDLESDYDYANVEHQVRADDEWAVEAEWDGPAKPGGWSDWVGRKVEKGDKWWDPMNGSTNASDIPSNFSPGVMSVLASTVRTAAHQDIARHAVLCRDTVHIKGVWAFDMGWGCGYRNALMALSAILSVPAYRPLFARENNGAEPGVRRVQGWLEEAWREGYDPEGRAQLKGKVLGSRKWIGPSDLYAMFTYKGIPCEIYDFPKPKDGKSSGRTAHIALQQWVRAYFSESKRSSPKTSAFDVLMRANTDVSGRGAVVRMTDKFPLILQHSGHSRTIVGYEENARGEVNLLLFDPGRSMPKDIRIAGLSDLGYQRAKVSQPLIDTPPVTAAPTAPGILRKRSSQSTHQTRPFSPPFTNGRAEIIESDQFQVESSAGEVDHMRGGTRKDSLVQSDEEVSPSGWVRKKTTARDNESNTTSSPVKTLHYFRVNLGNLSKHTQYQILAFTGGPVLSQRERESRKVVRSTVVWA
ncbi:hypothetical protein IAR55_003840 [Kwoniella newhampshirensis]|uniref:UFSP1/2/DUB catalytic domain-containing protein n=1 Tax=Kwoniella newhampshirensis TaxID=1651941 RepID=A0AAW0YKV6_9TREE